VSPPSTDTASVSRTDRTRRAMRFKPYRVH
jgi:hypothetical protein